MQTAEFIEVEDALWNLRALEAEKQGFLSAEESEKFLEELSNAED